LLGFLRAQQHLADEQRIASSGLPQSLVARVVQRRAEHVFGHRLGCVAGHRADLQPTQLAALREVEDLARRHPPSP